MDSILRGVEEAVRVDMPLAIEPVCWHPLENLETTMEVLEKVGDAAHLRIIFDASNLLKHPGENLSGRLLDPVAGGCGRFCRCDAY